MKYKSNYEGSGLTTQALRSPRIALEMYRSLQVLCAKLNAHISSIAMYDVVCGVCRDAIIFAYITFRSMSHFFIDELPGSLLYPVGLQNCLFAIFG